MIVSMNVSHFVKICQVFYTNLSVGVSLILGHVVYIWTKLIHDGSLLAYKQSYCMLTFFRRQLNK